MSPLAIRTLDRLVVPKARSRPRRTAPGLRLHHWRAWHWNRERSGGAAGISRYSLLPFRPSFALQALERSGGLTWWDSLVVVTGDEGLKAFREWVLGGNSRKTRALHPWASMFCYSVACWRGCWFEQCTPRTLNNQRESQSDARQSQRSVQSPRARWSTSCKNDDVETPLSWLMALSTTCPLRTHKAAMTMARAVTRPTTVTTAPEGSVARRSGKPLVGMMTVAAVVVTRTMREPRRRLPKKSRREFGSSSWTVTGRRDVRGLFRSRFQATSCSRLGAAAASLLLST